MRLSDLIINPALFPKHTTFSLTSSFAAVIITLATGGRRLTRKINTRRCKLLSLMLSLLKLDHISETVCRFIVSVIIQ